MYLAIVPDTTSLGITAIAVAGIVIVIFVFIAVWASRYTKVGPNEVLIVSGRQHRHTDADGKSSMVGMVVVAGLLSRNVTVCGRSTPELFGPGDVITAADLAGGAAPGDVRWIVHQPGVLGTLDERFVLASRRWPGLWQVVAVRRGGGPPGL